jgi:hypothetical protein
MSGTEKQRADAIIKENISVSNIFPKAFDLYFWWYIRYSLHLSIIVEWVP